MEALKIAKIKDGLYIGDKTAGTNIRLLIQFKISHMLITCANQIPFNYENAGIKYIAYNWPENPSNNIIFIKEELSQKILSFIDNSLQKGTGLMVLSIKGQNRAFAAIIIYLMRKYNWTLKKCREYLSTKKQDVRITKSFINQLTRYEERLIKKTNHMLKNDWFNINFKDKDELLMHNTYLNEKQLTIKNYLINKKKDNNEKKKTNKNNESNKIKLHIQWADYVNKDNCDNKLLISNCEINQDLFLQKMIIPITNHIEMRPIKSCIKYPKKSNNKKIFLKDGRKSLDKKGEKMSRNNQILKNPFFETDKTLLSRKLTYDNKYTDNSNIKKNYFDNNDNKIIIDSGQKSKIYYCDSKNENENEKNNNIKILINNYPPNDVESNSILEDKKRNFISNSEDKKNICNFNNYINLNDDINPENKNNINQNISQNNNNNLIKDNNKYSLYFQNSYQLRNHEKRGMSSKRDKKTNNVKLLANKKYYLGQSDSKNCKENEKDNDIIPSINKNTPNMTLSYEYNLNVHNNKTFIRSLITNKEIKDNINKSIGINKRYNEKREINSLDNKSINNNYNSKLKNKPKNAYIFDKFNLYSLKKADPIKLNNNNITYKLSQSEDTKNIKMNDKIFNSVNTYETLSKGINILSENRNFKYNNRPFSAQRNNLKNRNNFNNYYEFFGHHHQKRVPSAKGSKFSLMKNNTNNYNNKNFMDLYENKLSLSEYNIKYNNKV